MQTTMEKDAHPETSAQVETQQAITKTTKTEPVWYKRHDIWAMIVGHIVFGAIAGVIFGLGAWRGWDAPSGYNHDVCLTSQQRFLPEPAKSNDSYSHIRGRVGTDASSRWYYWKLKPWEVTVWTTLFAWVAYLSHQVAIWVLIYLAQLHKATSSEPKYTTTLNKYNWISLAVNTFFHILHVVQTHTTYDGLAQELTVTTPQSSATALFIWVMVLEYSERGLLFHWPTSRDTGKWSRRLRLNLKPVYLVRKYHAYAFAWASIHTVWYHPMENTYGHVLGFYHTWLFLLQGSLMYTKVHQNRWLRLHQEVMVGIHGGLVALQTGGPALRGTQLWPMFTFGAFFMTVFTWIFILDIWAKIPKWTRVIPLIVFIAVAIGAYSQIPDNQGRMFVRIQEVIRFPMIFYFGFAVAYLILYLFMQVDEKIHGTGLAPTEVSTQKKVVYIIAFMFVYAVMVVVSMVLELCDFQASMFISMAILLVTYTIGASAGMLFIKHIIPRRQMAKKTTGSKGALKNQVEPVQVVTADDIKPKPVSIVAVEDGQRVEYTAESPRPADSEDTQEMTVSHASTSSEGSNENLPNDSA